MQLGFLIGEAALADRGMPVRLEGDGSTDVEAVTMDSRAVAPRSLFACVPGSSADGHDHAAAAVSAGAVALLCERPLSLGVPEIVVGSVRQALGPVCDAFYGHPSSALTVVGVTGTNGKTTTVELLRGIFDAAGLKATTVGTLTGQRTTPEAPQLHSLLASWRSQGGKAVAMEVSSHALHQHRTDAVSFAAGVFTNLSPDHLDYHGTMEEYFAAKARLFENGNVGVAVVNTDDPWGRRLLDRLHDVPADRRPTEVLGYSLGDASDIRLAAGGSSFRWRGAEMSIGLGGSFNVANAVAAAVTAVALGIDVDSIVRGLGGLSGVPGRFQVVDEGQPFSVIVDYAHTPDGIAKVLDAAREVCPGRLLIVFGAGGDRDREKRPLMAQAAVARADVVVLTSDNPRSEEPASIIAEMLPGAGGGAEVVVEVDRAEAIEMALMRARPGDVVVIAGKGHEKGQEIGGTVRPFDDVERARAVLSGLAPGRSR